MCPFLKRVQDMQIKKTTKEIWDSLSINYEGIEDVQLWSTKLVA